MSIFRQSRRHLFVRLAALSAMLFSVRSLISHAAMTETKKLQKWQCTNQDCDPYIYDPSAGDENVIAPDYPIPPGVAFKDLPGSWVCPVCADPKRFFVASGEWVEFSDIQAQ